MSGPKKQFSAAARGNWPASLPTVPLGETGGTAFPFPPARKPRADIFQIQDQAICSELARWLTLERLTYETARARLLERHGIKVSLHWLSTQFWPKYCVPLLVNPALSPVPKDCVRVEVPDGTTLEIVHRGKIYRVALPPSEGEKA